METQNEYMDVAPDAVLAGDASLSPLDRIRAAAKQFEIPIKDPKSNCTACYGRGYTGINKAHRDEPIPCKCIMPDMNAATKMAYDDRQFMPHNRTERRAAYKMMRRKK
jgi:hypothetical protein